MNDSKELTIDPGISKQLEILWTGRHLNDMKTPLCSLLSLIWSHKNKYFAYTLLAKNFHVNFRQKSVHKCNYLKFVSAWNFRHPKYLQCSFKYILSSWTVSWWTKELELGLGWSFNHLKRNFVCFCKRVQCRSIP